MKDDTKIVTAGRSPREYRGAVNPPVYHASTVLYPTLQQFFAMQDERKKGTRDVYYGRMGTPTHFALEDGVAALEGGYRALTYPSGLAAIAAALLAFTQQGDHVLVSDSVYGPTRRFCDTMLARFGVRTTYFDPLVGAGIAELLQPETRLVYLESPGSLTFEVQDVPAIAEAAHRAGAVVLFDNTWGTPLYFKPFAHGVDVSIHAATKYIVGHSDAMLGLCTATEEAWPRLENAAHELGQIAGPDDAYLGHRGLRTLGVRLRRHMETGLRLAEWWSAQPEAACVMHPALPGDPGHALWRRDFTGACGLFGVTLRPCSQAQLTALIDSLELFGLGASWGGYESLVLVSNPNSMRSARRWPHAGQVVRFHAGLEDPEDLIADLENAMRRFRAAGT